MAGQGRRLTLAPRGRKQSCLAGQYSLPPHRSAPGRVGLPPPSPQLSMAAQFVDQGREHAIVDETSAGIDLLRCRVIPPAGLVGRMPQFLSAPIHHEEFNVFSKLAEGEGPQVNYNINENDYTMGYYLADGIYPSWATFMKTIHESRGNKKKYFAKAQEACRKDFERAFGVLQSRFAIVRAAARLWDEESLGNIMMACIIIHNMIVEDEREDEDYL